MLCHNFDTRLNHTRCAIARKVRLVGITVSRTSRSLATAHPVLEGQRGRIDTANDTEGGEGNVGDYLAPGSGTSTEMKKGRVHVDQRNTSKTSDQRNELVQIIGAAPSDKCADNHQEEAESVLLPFDIRVVFATASEKLVLHDTNGGEELQGCTE